MKNAVSELQKLNAAGLRHGEVVQSNFYVGKDDEVFLVNPEIDEEIVDHLPSDLVQFKEMLFHLERDLDHEPEALWEAVDNDSFFKKLK